MSGHRIGNVARALEIGIDTLRYYEKIKLMPRVPRVGGARIYNDADIARLRFVRRAQAMGFTLDEIRRLLELRREPGRARPAARVLARKKLDEIHSRISELKLLQTELTLLLNLCNGADTGCPIFENLEQQRSGRAKMPRKARRDRPAATSDKEPRR